MATPDTSHDQLAALLSVEEAARRLRIGRTTMYVLISTRQIETVTIGRRRLVPPECVAAYVTALRTATPPAPAAALGGTDHGQEEQRRTWRDPKQQRRIEHLQSRGWIVARPRDDGH